MQMIKKYFTLILHLIILLRFSGITSARVKQISSEKVKAKINADNYQTVQSFFTSKDGTKVPLFITYKKGLKLDGNNPTLLYGYGGFNIPLTPAFSISNAFFLEQGGVSVIVNLRGGSEYGEAWHKAGMLEKKQNVF